VHQSSSLPIQGCHKKFLLKKGTVNKKKKRLRNTGLHPQ
jgi:hypothetical protein